MTLPLRARQEHVFILGSTGSGKSRALLHLMRQAIQRDEGLLFLDPHGNHPDSVYRALIATLNTTRPVCLIDFGAPQVVGFNPLYCPEGTDPSVVVGSVMDALAVTWEGESFTQKPTIERNLSAILTALVELKLTLCEAEYLLDAKDARGLRSYAIQHVKDPFTRGELQRLHDLAHDGRRKRDYDQEVIGSINRLSRLLRPPAVRAMLGQNDKCLDLSQVYDAGGIVLANLSGGADVYETDTDLFGRLLTRTALFYAKRRKNTRPFNLVLDEAHHFLTADVPVLLAEVRKYGVSVIAAMQWLQQARRFDENILAALLNVNCKILFRLRDAEESEQLARATVPLNLERPVSALIKPTVIGHRRIQLANGSDSRQQSRTESEATTNGTTRGTSETHGETIATSHAEFESDSEVDTATEMHSESEGEIAGHSAAEIMIPTDNPDDPIISRVTAGESGAASAGSSSGTAYNHGTVKSHGTMDSVSRALSHAITHSFAESQAKTKGTAHTVGTGHSDGFSEALEPILEKLPTAVHGLQNELYAAGALLRSLPTSVGYLSFVGTTGPVTTLFQVPPILTPSLPDEAFESLRDRLIEQSGIAKSRSEALQAVIEREQAIQRLPEPHQQIETKLPKRKQRRW